MQNDTIAENKLALSVVNVVAAGLAALQIFLGKTIAVGTAATSRVTTVPFVFSTSVEATPWVAQPLQGVGPPLLLCASVHGRWLFKCLLHT